MAITETTNKVQESGDGAEVDFDFDFKIFASSNLEVYKINTSTDVATLQTITTDYTVAINAVTEGGTVTYVVAPTSSEDSFIKRVMALTQEEEFPTEGNLPETAFENGLDKNTMILQQFDEELSRIPKFGTTSETSDITMPEPEAGKALQWNSGGTDLENSTTAIDAVVDSAAASAAAAASSATDAETAQTAAELAETNAETAETNAAASAASVADFTNEGLWSSGTTYAEGNIVTFTQTTSLVGSFQSLQSSNTNQNPETETAYWARLAQDGDSDVSLRSDLTITLLMSSIEEVLRKGLVTNYTQNDDPLNFPATSSNAYEFPQANISTSGGPFTGLGSYDFSNTAFSLVIPSGKSSFGSSQVTSDLDLSGAFSITFWIKSPAVASTTIMETTDKSFKITINSSGLLIATILESDGTSSTTTGTTDLRTGTSWHNIIITGEVNNAGSDQLNVYVDGSSEGTPVASGTLATVGADSCNLILGSGYARAGDTILDMDVLPSADTPAWAFTGTDEGTDCAVSGGVLTIDTVGGSGGTATAVYTIAGGANWTVSNADGYWVDMKCRVTAGTGALTLVADDGTKKETVLIYSDKVTIANNGTTLTYFLDASVYHTYRLAVKTTVSTLFIDGVESLVGVSAASSADSIHFGDETASTYNITADIDYVHFYQTASEETGVFDLECDALLSDLGVFNTIISSADITALQSASVQNMNQLVDGSSIVNPERIHAAIADLIDQRDYEENLDNFSAGHTDTDKFIQQMLQFSTKKRVIPTILSTVTIEDNLDTLYLLSISVDGFCIYPFATVAGHVQAGFMWQAQCASLTKIKDFNEQTGAFSVMLGTPIIDLDGDHTGEYSQEEVSKTVSDIELSNDEKTLHLKLDAKTSIHIPTNNSVELVDALYDDTNLAKQVIPLVIKKIGIVKHNKIQNKLKLNPKIQAELKQIEKNKERKTVKGKVLGG